MAILTMPAAVFVSSTASGALLPISAPTAVQQVYELPATQVTISPVDLSFDAAWLSIVEQRIKASIAPEGYIAEEDGAWLQIEVGSTAVDFFRSTSSALPSEPYIYASKAGDLVAEFIGPRGKLICIVAKNAVYVFAVAEDETVERKFLPSEVVELRSHLQTMTNMLRPARQNATLGAR
jgi:hypothetical protein